VSQTPTNQTLHGRASAALNPWATWKYSFTDSALCPVFLFTPSIPISSLVAYGTSDSLSLRIKPYIFRSAATARAVRNYEPDDRIFLFGFSRGA
jgi:hypothetical protein